MGLPVCGGGLVFAELEMPTHVGPYARLPLVATSGEGQHFAGGLTVGEDLAFNDELVSLNRGHALPEDALEPVVVAHDDRHGRRERHAGQVDHDRLAAPALAYGRAGVGDDPKLLRTGCGLAVGGLQKRHV